MGQTKPTFFNDSKDLEEKNRTEKSVQEEKKLVSVIELVISWIEFVEQKLQDIQHSTLSKSE